MFEGNLLGCEHEYKMPIPCCVLVFGFCMKRRYLAVVYLDTVLSGDQLLFDLWSSRYGLLFVGVLYGLPIRRMIGYTLWRYDGIYEKRVVLPLCIKAQHAITYDCWHTPVSASACDANSLMYAGITE